MKLVGATDLETVSAWVTPINCRSTRCDEGESPKIKKLGMDAALFGHIFSVKAVAPQKLCHEQILQIETFYRS